MTSEVSVPDAMRADLRRSMRKRKLTLIVLSAIAIFAALFVAPVWEFGGYARNLIEWAGAFLILVCIAGRTWCSLYIGGQKVRNLIETGPYSIARNPLYLFSIVGAIGLGAAYGMVCAAIIDGAVALALLTGTIPREEALMESVHGDAYRAYHARVPRLLPRFALWRDAPVLEVRPGSVRRMFLDSCIFLAAVPLARLIEYLHVAGWITPILRLP